MEQSGLASLAVPVFAQHIAYLPNVCFVFTITAVFVLHLYHDDGSTVLYGERSQLSGHFLFEPIYTRHEVRILFAQAYILLLEQPPGQSAHLPFGTHIGAGTNDNVHAVLLGQPAELCHIILPAEVKLSLALLMDVPEDIDADGVHAQCLAHLDAMLPVGAWDARIVNLGSLDHKGFAVKQKRLVACGECVLCLGQCLLPPCFKSLGELLVLLGSYLNHRTMPGSEGSGSLRVGHPTERAKVVGAGKLVMSGCVTVVHQAPAAVDEREYSGSLHIILGLLTEPIQQSPCAWCVQITEYILADALVCTLLLRLEEEMVFA